MIYSLFKHLLRYYILPIFLKIYFYVKKMQFKNTCLLNMNGFANVET